jgi:predicted dehydrogenase
MQKEKIGIGVAGCGKAGQAHLHWYANNTLCQIVGVYDPSGENAAKCADLYGAQSFDTFEALVSSGDIDLVSLCGPSSVRARQAVMACDRGKHLILEKPMAKTLEECDEIIAVAARNNVKLMCFLNMRFHPVVETIDDIISQIGRIYHISLEYTQFRTNITWRHKREQGGGVMKAQGVHPIDLALHWMGDVDHVSAETLIVNPGREVEDHCVSLLRFKSNATGMIHSSYVDRQDEAMFGKISGTLGKINFTISPYKPELNQVTLITDHEDQIPVSAYSIVDPVYPGLLDATQCTMDHFVECVAENTASPLDGIAGRRALEVVLACYGSQAAGNNLQLPLERTPDLCFDKVFSE